jgi:hypothetical protein
VHQKALDQVFHILYVSHTCHPPVTHNTAQVANRIHSFYFQTNGNRTQPVWHCRSLYFCQKRTGHICCTSYPNRVWLLDSGDHGDSGGKMMNVCRVTRPFSDANNPCQDQITLAKNNPQANTVRWLSLPNIFYFILFRFYWILFRFFGLPREIPFPATAIILFI